MRQRREETMSAMGVHSKKGGRERDNTRRGMRMREQEREREPEVHMSRCT